MTSLTWTTVNWAQLSNEYRANEQAGDRAELSGHQVVWQKCSKSIYIGIIYINGYVTNAGQRTNKQEKIGQPSLCCWKAEFRNIFDIFC